MADRANGKPVPHLRFVRESKFVSIPELSEESKCSRASIYIIENGGRAHFKTIRALAEALGVEPSELVEEQQT